ncbi:MAG: phage holin family protein [Candidatus Ventricola sp.]
MDRVYRLAAAALGAVVSFFTGMPVMMWVLIGVMSIDYVTGLCCGAMGVSPKTQTGGLSSRAAFKGLLRKGVVLLVVLLAVLVDLAVESGAGVEFSAVTGATCLWFIASEGVSVLENAAAMGLPIPAVLKKALDVMRSSGGAEDDQDE